MEKNKEWIITTTKGKEPISLREIAFLTEDEEFTLDKLVGKDFAVEITKNPLEKPHFDNSLEKIVIKNIDDILVLLHEAGHGIMDIQDKFTRKILGKIEGRIRNQESIKDFDIDEIREILLIRSEMMASVYAIKKLRELRDKKGINLIKGNVPVILSRIKQGIESNFSRISSTKEYKEKLKEIEILLKKNK